VGLVWLKKARTNALLAPLAAVIAGDSRTSRTISS